MRSSPVLQRLSFSLTLLTLAGAGCASDPVRPSPVELPDGAGGMVTGGSGGSAPMDSGPVGGTGGGTPKDGPTTSVSADAVAADASPSPADTGPASSPRDAGALTACPATPTAYTAQMTIHYANNTNLSQSLDIFVPHGPGPYPVLIWIPGGGWVTGSKGSVPATVKALASRGYVVVSTNHRPSSAAKFPAQIQDIKAAIRFLRANAARFKINPDAIGISGNSSGGHLSALAGTSGGVAAFDDLSHGNPGVSSRVQAAVPFFGPSDFLKMNLHAKENGCPGGSLDHDSITSPESRLLGCQLQTCPDKAGVANPITYIGADDPPFLVQHGATDCTVPPGQSKVLHDALRAANVPSTLIIRPNVGHSRAPYDAVDFFGFLDATLRGCRSSAAP
jgi:acetyl esterase/lipase